MFVFVWSIMFMLFFVSEERGKRSGGGSVKEGKNKKRGREQWHWRGISTEENGGGEERN